MNNLNQNIEKLKQFDELTNQISDAIKRLENLIKDCKEANIVVKFNISDDENETFYFVNPSFEITTEYKFKYKVE